MNKRYIVKQSGQMWNVIDTHDDWPYCCQSDTEEGAQHYCDIANMLHESHHQEHER